MLIKKVHHKTKLILGLLIITSLSGCDSNTNKNDSNDETVTNTPKMLNHSPEMTVIKSTDEPKQASPQMLLKGQILYQQMEGGFYGFVAHNGDKYMPTGLSNEFRKHGLIVELKAELMPDIVTTQRFGDVIKILEIKVLDSSQVSPPNKSNEN